jgi:hypothetical protein
MGHTIATVEVVIHTDYGGFHINTEMALWLMENRNWKIASKDMWDKTEGFQLIESLGDYFYPTREFENAIRTNKDFIDCVRAIKKLHEDDEYPESYYGYIHKLSIVNLKVNLDIENYHDGKERVSCSVSETRSE